MSEKLTKEEFFNTLQCVRCGTIENLKSYKHSSFLPRSVKSSRHYTRVTGITYTNEFPVCKTCGNKFKRYRLIYKVSDVNLFLGITALLYGGVALLFSYTMEASEIRIPAYLSITIGMIVAVIAGVVFGFNITSVDKPKNYIRIGMYGKAIIKPEKSEDWFPYNEWVDYVSKDRILKGNVDPSIQIKLTKILENNIQKDIKEQARISSILPCPECGNLNDILKRSTCEICGSTIKK